MRGLLFFFSFPPPSLFRSTGGDGVDPLTVCVNRQLQAPARQLCTRGEVVYFLAGCSRIASPRRGPGTAAGGRGALRGRAAGASRRVPPHRPRRAFGGEHHPALPRPEFYPCKEARKRLFKKMFKFLSPRQRPLGLLAGNACTAVVPKADSRVPVSPHRFSAPAQVPRRLQPSPPAEGLPGCREGPRLQGLCPGGAPGPAPPCAAGAGMLRERWPQPGGPSPPGSVWPLSRWCWRCLLCSATVSAGGLG